MGDDGRYAGRGGFKNINPGIIFTIVTTGTRPHHYNVVAGRVRKQIPFYKQCSYMDHGDMMLVQERFATCYVSDHQAGSMNRAIMLLSEPVSNLLRLHSLISQVRTCCHIFIPHCYHDL